MNEDMYLESTDIYHHVASLLAKAKTSSRCWKKKKKKTSRENASASTTEYHVHFCYRLNP